MFCKTLGLGKSSQLHLIQALSPRMSRSTNHNLTWMLIQFRGWLWLRLICINHLVPFLRMQ